MSVGMQQLNYLLITSLFHSLTRVCFLSSFTFEHDNDGDSSIESDLPELVLIRQWSSVHGLTLSPSLVHQLKAGPKPR